MGSALPAFSAPLFLNSLHLLGPLLTTSNTVGLGKFVGGLCEEGEQRRVQEMEYVYLADRLSLAGHVLFQTISHKRNLSGNELAHSKCTICFSGHH
jgi:hypothetical protein